MTKQNILRLMPAVTLLMMGTAFAAPGKGANCTNVPIRVTMFQNKDTSLASAIYSDGAEYTNMVGGVSALIKVCEPQFGINAVWATGNAGRKFTFNFPSPLSGSNVQEQPSWAGKGPFLAPGIISVRSITWSHQPFTTHVGLSFTISRTTYEMRFMPETVDAPDLHLGDPTYDNFPFHASPATVVPQAYDCDTGGATKPSWHVYGNNFSDEGKMQAGTLRKPLKDGTLVHEGQYTTPFEFLIEAQTCYAYGH